VHSRPLFGAHEGNPKIVFQRNTRLMPHLNNSVFGEAVILHLPSFIAARIVAARAEFLA